MILLWLHIGDFCFLQITKYATHITNRGVTGNKTRKQITLSLIMKFKYTSVRTVNIAAMIHGMEMAQI